MSEKIDLDDILVAIDFEWYHEKARGVVSWLHEVFGLEIRPQVEYGIEATNGELLVLVDILDGYGNHIFTAIMARTPNWALARKEENA